MVNYQAEQWRRLFEDKHQKFLEEGCQRALAVQSFDDVLECLRDLTATHSRATFPGILDRLRPGLDHITSFTQAITSASQYSPAACLVWGSIQAVIQCASASTDLLDQIVGALSKLNNAMPLFEGYMNLFPNCVELQYPLQDIFDSYLSFCLGTISYLKRSGTINFLRFLWTSEPTTLLKKTREDIDHHFSSFKQGAALASRRMIYNKHMKIEHTLASNPIQLTNDTPLDPPDAEEHFPVSTVTLFQNHTFHGRTDVFDQLDQVFARSFPILDTLAASPADRSDSTTSQLGPTQSPACCVLHGLGGIGKTQTALEYTYRTRKDYDAIFWLPSEQYATLSSNYAAIAEKLHLSQGKCGSGGKDQGRAKKKVFEWLQNTKRRWLVVFDHVEDLNDLQAFLPTKTVPRGPVILPTQRPDFYEITDNFKLISMKEFDRDEGSRLLFHHLQRQPHDENEAEVGRQISDVLGGLPLAIATIGGYVNASACSPDEFLKDLKTSSNAWEAGSMGQVQQYEHTLQNVFEIAFRELEPRSRKMLNILAFLNPDYIPEELFLSDEPGEVVHKRAGLTEIVRQLRRRQLIRRDTSGPESYLSIHRTVQYGVLLNLSKDAENRWKVCKDAFDLLCRNLPEVSTIDNPEPEKWTQFEKYVPQVLNLRTHCLWPEPPVELPEEFVQVLSDMATFMWHAGLISQGYDALITAEHILDDHETPSEHPLRGNVHEHIGIIASFHGVSQRREAIARRHKALHDRRAAHATIPPNKVTREDEIRLFNVESDMAFGLMQEENFEESERYIEKCHDQYKKWGTPEEIPFEYLKLNHIISYIRMSQNKPVAAIQHCKEAAQLGTRCAGADHPMTQLCLFSLTNHLYLADELENAMKLSDSVLATRSKVCGEFNPFTMDSHAMCGFLRFKKDEYRKAEDHLSKCLDRRKRSVWNPEGVARAQYIYSQVLDKLGRKEEAKKHLKEALRARDYHLEHFPEYVKPNKDDLAVFDQMVCLWGGRFTGALAQDDLLLQEECPSQCEP